MDVALKLSFCICSFKNANTKWLRKGITCYCTEKKELKKTSNDGGLFDERRSRNILFSIQVTSLKFNRWDIILTVYLWIKLDNEPICLKRGDSTMTALNDKWHYTKALWQYYRQGEGSKESMKLPSEIFRLHSQPSFPVLLRSSTSVVKQ